MTAPEEVKAFMTSKQLQFHRLELWKKKKEANINDKGPSLAEAATENISCNN